MNNTISRSAVLTQTEGKRLACTHFSTAITNVTAQAESATQLSQILGEQYPWFDAENRKQAMALLPGAVAACHYRLVKQIYQYQQKLVDLVTKDMADRTADHVLQLKQFSGLRHHLNDSKPVGPNTFEIPIGTKGAREEVWIYVHLEEFAHFVPPRALLAIADLESSGIIPDRFWVADKIERPLQTRYSGSTGNAGSRRLDPVLCAQFGRYLVGLSAWD